MTSATKTEAKPKFDFSNTSYRWNRRYLAANAAIQTAAQGLSSDDLSMFESVEEAMDERDKLIIQVLVGVPASMLITDAPEDIAWDSIDDFGYVRADSFNDLVTALSEELNSSKN